MREKLLKEIEAYRQKMVHLSTSKPLSSKEVVEISMQLDHLLNQYESIK